MQSPSNILNISDNHSVDPLYKNNEISQHKVPTLNEHVDVHLTSEEIRGEFLTSLFPSKLSLREFEEHENDCWVTKLEEAFQLRNSRRSHRLHTRDRADMVDWMLEVTSTFKCKEVTFFKAVEIMDLFYVRHRV